MKAIHDPKIELISITTDAERIIEKAARRCYFGTEFEELPEGNLGEYLKKLMARNHLSVFEHAYATFDMRDVSRVFLAQISRHRIASMNVESQRYRDQSENDIVLPPDLYNSTFRQEVLDYAQQGKDLYTRMINSGIKKEDARYILLNGGTTSIIFTANFRELLHIMELREAPQAQREIRVGVTQMRAQLHVQCPDIF